MKTLVSNLFIILLFASSCTVSKKQLAGTYFNSHYGDSLYLYEDGSYEYAENLVSGRVGWTEGKWYVSRKSITFQCDHRPLVGYSMKVRPDSLVNDFQIRLTMGDTDEPIYIESVAMYQGPVSLNYGFVHSDNVVKIIEKNFDSIIVRTFNFRGVKFIRDIQPGHAYVAEIYPVERLYELDKVPFLYKKKSLKSTRTSAYPDIDITFRKTGK